MFGYLTAFVLISAASSQLYDPNLYSPSSNLIINPTFSSPSLGGSMVQFASGSILGWTFNNIQLVTVSVFCSNFGAPCSHNFSQGIELDVSNVY